jgi:hypothetical protein
VAKDVGISVGEIRDDSTILTNNKCGVGKQLLGSP